jgi:hypothetical protein
VVKAEIAANDAHRKWQEASASLFAVRETMYAMERIIADEKRRLEKIAVAEKQQGVIND